MFAAGEASGNLEEALTHAAAYYNEEVPRRVKKAFSIIEPIIILFLVGIIGAVAMAIFLPILSITQGINS
jgi:type II secretory pathway component PulF